MTSQEFSAQAHLRYEEYIKRHPEDCFDGSKYPALCGIMSAMAATQIVAAAHVTVEETDTIGLLGYNLMVYEDGMATKLKASLKIPQHDQWKKLLRQMVEDWVGDDVDWSAVDLSGLEED